MVLLTPKDIREHRFQLVRFKEGYNADEVDEFLDQVTETIEALGKQAVAGGQSTQALGPEVSSLNTKISDLTAQVQQLQNENTELKNVAAAASSNNDNDVLTAKLNEATAKLSETEEANRTPCLQQ